MVIDYDPVRWVLTPPAGTLDPEQWAASSARSWAGDLGLSADGSWEDVLRRMLLAVLRIPMDRHTDARLIHVLTPAGEAASLMPVDLSMGLPDEVPGGIAKALPRPADPALIEPPLVESVPVRDGVKGTRIVRFLNDGSDGELRVELFFAWRGHPQADMVLNTSSYEIGRVLLMQDDIAELARHISLQPVMDPA